MIPVLVKFKLEFAAAYRYQGRYDTYVLALDDHDTSVVVFLDWYCSSSVVFSLRTYENPRYC